MQKLRSITLFGLMVGSLMLVGCGQRGPLTLPEPAEDNQTSSFEQTPTTTNEPQILDTAASTH